MIGSAKVWVPVDEVEGAYVFMLEVRNGVRWVLVSEKYLTPEQRAKYGANHE